MDERMQERVLRDVIALGQMRDDWGGALVLAVGLNERGVALALAAHIVGAVCLAIDAAPERCRAALRLGACDFVVNSVDEALRAMKNEVRKRQPLSVALACSPAEALAELQERGLAPQLFAAFEPGFASFQGSAAGFDENLPLPVEYLAERGLQLAEFPFASGAELREFDALVLKLIPASDPRRRWVVAAPRHFHRGRPPHRTLLLTQTERELLERSAPVHPN